MKLRERLGRQAFLTQKAQQAFVVDQSRSADQLAEAKRSIRKGAKARKALQDAVFGEESFFHANAGARFRASVTRPTAAMDLALPGCDSVPRSTVDSVRLRCFWRGREATCYATVTCQTLLRLPSVLAWLAWHVDQCEDGETCVACLLFRSRLQLGEALPAQLGRRCALVGEIFEEALPHEASEFLVSLLEAMRRCEVLAGRSVVWPGLQISQDSVVATHVDRLFAFVEEVRSQCSVCGQTQVRYERQTQLRLPVRREQEAWDRSLGDAYLEYCGPQQTLEPCCRCGVGAQAHRIQRRLVTMPEVLSVQVLRAADDGSVARYPFCVDEQVSLPSLPSVSLSAVVFHFGRQRERGHYTCACRGPDGLFWYFDDAREPVAVRKIVGFFDKNVDALLYVRSGSEASVQHGSEGTFDSGGVRPSGADDDMKVVRAHVSASRGVGSDVSAAPVRAPGPDRQTVLLEYQDQAYQVWEDRSFRSLLFDGAEFRDKILAASRETLSGEALDFYDFAAGCREHCFKSADFVPFEYRLHAHQSWGGRTFRALFFDDVEFRDKMLAALPETLSGSALEFYQFAAGCRRHGFQSADFDQVEGEVKATRAPEREVQRLAAQRRAKELAERKRELAQAAQKKREADAKARLFATSVQSGGKGESSAGASAGGASQPSSASQSAVHASASAGSRQSGRPGAAPVVRDSILQTRLCRRLVELRLEDDILEAVLGQLQAMFGQGRAWDLANEGGFAQWERWVHFVAEIQLAKNSWSEGLFIVHVQRQVSELLFALERAFGVVKTISNEEAVEALRRVGLQYRIGEVWGENDCCLLYTSPSPRDS